MFAGGNGIGAIDSNCTELATLKFKRVCIIGKCLHGWWMMSGAVYIGLPDTDTRWWWAEEALSQFAHFNFHWHSKERPDNITLDGLSDAKFPHICLSWTVLSLYRLMPTLLGVFQA